MTDPTTTRDGPNHGNSATSSDASVLDVRDYGAEGDGETDDSAAIQRAIDTAGTGETVYVPETNAHYNVALTSGQSVFEVDGSSHADDITLQGGGPNARIRLADDPDDGYALLNVTSPANFTFTMRDLVFDGNRRNVDTEGQPGHCLRFRDTEPSGTGDILVEDVVVQNANTTGASIQYGGVTLNRCTARNNRSHGISISTDVSGAHDPPVVIRNSLSTANGDAGGFYAIDCSGGKGVVEDCVLQASTHGTKTSENAIRFTYRRVRIRHNEGAVMRNTSSGTGVDVVFEDVIGEHNGGSWRMGERGHYRIVDGSAILASNNGPDEDDVEQIAIQEDAILDASNADVYSNRAVEAAGLGSRSSASGSTIENYYHYQNDGGATDTTDNLTIANRAELDRTDLADVPRANAVGAWSGI